jgi:hypothetical protein
MALMNHNAAHCHDVKKVRRKRGKLKERNGRKEGRRTGRKEQCA